MKIQFDGDQPYQRDAINAVLEVFEGQPLAAGAFEIRLDTAADAGGLFDKLGSGNQLALNDDALLANICRVQQRNGITESTELAGKHFSVEMETGTGKTYVYLRTMHELHQRHGFCKFIIVVPSVAIREGVMASLRLTREHFATLYGNVPVDAWVYDSRQVSKLRQFAAATTLQVLVINIDAFNKPSNNVIHRDNDLLSGRKPIEFIQATRPIVIMDEPQNMESAPAQEAIASLSPLCTLRYSATHRNLYHLLYRLNPVQAYDLKLVKRIEVDSVLDDPDFNQPYIHVESVKATAKKITAKMSIDVNAKGAPQRKTIAVSKGGADLHELSGGREGYKGYIVDEIDAGNQRISFANGLTLDAGQTHGGRSDDVMRVQIRETVREHFEKEKRIRKVLPAGQRLKVLSLFFIDRVANYAAADGKIRRWFTEAYLELSAKYPELEPLPVDKVHNGYFAQARGVAKDTRGDTAADDEAYELIMRDKERLLSPEEPLRFIFSHSALREGWDNPNVFQICTLNETKSEIKKRQEIGRGLRLPVLETGERCFDPAINRLTVIANESYEEFARQLQTEIEEECGVSFVGRIANKKKQRTAKLRPGWKLNPDFQALWERIKHQTRYAVDYKSKILIDAAAKRLAGMDAIKPSAIRVQKAELRVGEQGLNTALLSVTQAKAGYQVWKIPDLLGYLQGKTELTRSTLAEILIQSGRLGEVKHNPQQFLDQALLAIETELRELMVAGIKYERIAGREYEMMLFEEKEITGYLTGMIEVDNSIYDVVPYDSEVERKFAEAMSTRDDIKLFIKLPPWFKVETPVGTYNPDWAIVREHDEKVYLVRETKGTMDELKLRGTEWMKIQCGKAHFHSLGVDYAHVVKADEIR
ncbi:MAG: DEAD/DEAH box helicase family protein [Burkholderiales bacterium]|jgi:type III restriction enzyme|nr:DEAD/DEAH box helicase family protein [Burkholderiales bacterium]